MNLEKSKHIQTLAENQIRQDFQNLKEKIEQDGKTILGFYCEFVDDYYAVANFAITKEDFENCDDNESLLSAVWSGECEIYEPDFTPMNTNAENWLDNQSELYKEAYLWGHSDNDENGEIYQNIRKEFEKCMINALKNCDEMGVFGNRGENGILLFSYYADDYDENGENSILKKSATMLNSTENIKKIAHWL